MIGGVPASNLRASAATTAAARLEAAADTGDSAEVPALAEKLKIEIKRTIEHLQSNKAARAVELFDGIEPVATAATTGCCTPLFGDAFGD